MQKRIVLFLIFVGLMACSGQDSAKTIVIGQNGQKVTLDGEKTGIILSMSPSVTESSTTYYYQVSEIQGPVYFSGSMVGGELRFIELYPTYYALTVTAARNGVIGRGYREFHLQPMEKLALQVSVYFPTGNSAGVTVSIVDVTVPTVYVRPSDTIHTVPINGRGIVVAVDITHDWSTPLNLWILKVSTGGANHPFTLANCDFQNADGVTIGTVPTIQVDQVWDNSHTYSHYYATFSTDFSYQMPASTVTTLQVVCDIWAGHDFVDFTVDGLGIDYSPLYYVDFGSWANNILAE